MPPFIENLLNGVVTNLLSDKLKAILDNPTQKADFKKDMMLLCEKLKDETALDVFLFASRAEVKSEKEYISLEEVYILLIVF